MSLIKHTMPLVTERKLFLLQFLRWGAIVFFGLTIFSLFKWSGPTTGTFLIIGVVMSGMVNIIRNYEIIGRIKLTSDEIIVEITDGEFFFGLSDIKHLEILLRGISGEFYGPKAITIKQGMYNYIRFEYQGTKKEFMLLLQDADVPFLRTIFEAWRQKNIDFRLTNQTQQEFS
ncbi:hypothetical protein [Chitinophaga defluvii]|uniref:PH (Pleckstrin Homology) domain-containing protein n=1 Tax=Chitinophaga defluvii TaxID=3163343 RepID=A0ABV2TAL6_9BACT